jgi:hypothetical protein
MQAKGTGGVGGIVFYQYIVRYGTWVVVTTLAVDFIIELGRS